MLVDKLRVDFQAGKGGDGAVSFGRDRKPSGGDGGKGADIYLEGSASIYDLTFISHEDEFEAENGRNGGDERKTGRSGEDLVLKVPLTTIVYSATTREKLLTISEPGEKKLLIKGGRGGLGNFNFRRGQVPTLYKHTKGDEGAKLKAILELRLNADIIFIGLPNAGKSSMLNALTNSKVKVADYPFTTLQPHLGVSESMVLMDLPGLIEGAALGKGLGKKFLKHTLAAKVIAHFINLESSDPVADYKTIRAELENMSTELTSKPEIIFLTKADQFSEAEIAKQKKLFSKFKRPILVTSAYQQERLAETKKTLKNLLAEIQSQA